MKAVRAVLHETLNFKIGESYVLSEEESLRNKRGSGVTSHDDKDKKGEDNNGKG